jgi:hypothetical protein
MQPILDLADDGLLSSQVAVRAQWAATVVAYRLAAMDDK